MPKQTNFDAGGELLEKVADFAFGGKVKCLPEGYDARVYSKAFGDADLVNSCFCLFKNDLNVSRTAGELYMHRNTLIYRIAKLKRMTGLDVSKFSDAVSFIILYRFYCGEKGKNAGK